MEKINNVLCTRCGSHHIISISDTEYKCENCDAIITKTKAEDFEKVYQKLIKEGKDFDIANLRELVKTSLSGHINLEVLKMCSLEILEYLPRDVLSNFYLKFIEKNNNPFAYEDYLKQLIYEATITEMDDIIELIITNTKKRDEEIIRQLSKHFYNDKYDNMIDEAIKHRQIEVELYSDIPRDIFICHSSKDKLITNQILTTLENDGNVCWISSRNIPWNTNDYWNNITKAIKSCDIFLCLNSINTMASSDCRREIEIAASLDMKKRIEYKIDTTNDITLFKNFFIGQWITNINDLLQKVYELKHKENNLEKEIFVLLEENNLLLSKEKLNELLNITNDNDIKDKCTIILQAINLIEENMYEEAKTILLQCLDVNYTKDLLKLCSKHIDKKESDKEKKDEKNNFEENINKEENNYEKSENSYKYTNYTIKDIKQLIKSRQYDTAKQIIIEKINCESSFLLWYYYLICETKKFRDFSSNNLQYIFDNLVKETPRLFWAKVRKLNKKYEKKTKSSLQGNKLKVVNNEVYFGEYPQSLKPSNVTIISSMPDTNGYYDGSDGEKYVYTAVTKVGYETKRYQYYFKVEPLKWKVIAKKKGIGLLVCDNIIHSCVFCDGVTNYEKSNVRKWLNNDFYNVAFTENEKKLIKNVLVDNSKKSGTNRNKMYCDNTFDKVFILSKKDCQRTKFDIRRNRTDFARLTSEMQEDLYWLRTNESDVLNYVVYAGGDVNTKYSNLAGGVVPVICVPVK